MSDTLNVARTIKYSKCNQNSLILEKKTYYGKGKGEKRIYQFSGGAKYNSRWSRHHPTLVQKLFSERYLPTQSMLGEKKGKKFLLFATKINTENTNILKTRFSDSFESREHLRAVWYLRFGFWQAVLILAWERDFMGGETYALMFVPAHLSSTSPINVDLPLSHIYLHIYVVLWCTLICRKKVDFQERKAPPQKKNKKHAHLLILMILANNFELLDVCISLSKQIASPCDSTLH